MGVSAGQITTVEVYTRIYPTNLNSVPSSPKPRQEGIRAGSFAGLSDVEWPLLADIFPPEPAQRGRGMPRTPFRKVVHTLLYMLRTGCRWCDLPRGPQWASKRAAHRGLQRWQTDGTLVAMQARLLGIAEAHGMMQWQYGAVDGSVSPWHRRR